ncbi:MAG: hypothetical protein ABIO05_03630 [Ferruginibacter sp.]
MNCLFYISRVFLLTFFLWQSCQAQVGPVYKDATKDNREKLDKHLREKTIHKNLSTALNESTEDRWEDAFYALALLQFKNAFIESKIKEAVTAMPNRSIDFQRSLITLLYDSYPGLYAAEVRNLLLSTTDAKLAAICGEYLLLAATLPADKKALLLMVKSKKSAGMDGPHLQQLEYNITNSSTNINTPSIHTLLAKNYLKGEVLLISFQRKDRNYPGLVMVRDTAGRFVKQDDDKFFAVPQLARSINNLPGYLTNGNTPEGILRMDGFEVSGIGMIGPSTNVQLTLPFEFKAGHFYKDSTLIDSAGSLLLYNKLLPQNFRTYYPMQQAFFAGKAGRSEIIAHGTTVDPAYYAGLPYYPLTPTMGCLCTMELWSSVDGKRVISDQQLLANAITKAGGPHGYAIVVNIDDKKQAVLLNDILPFLKLAGQQ